MCAAASEAHDEVMNEYFAYDLYKQRHQELVADARRAGLARRLRRGRRTSRSENH